MDVYLDKTRMRKTGAPSFAQGTVLAPLTRNPAGPDLKSSSQPRFAVVNGATDQVGFKILFHCNLKSIYLGN